MKKAILKTSFIAIGALALSLGALTTGIASNALNNTNSDSRLNEATATYQYGDTYNVDKTVKIIESGVEITPSKYYLEYPDGSVLPGETFVLNQYGKYYVIYEGNVNGIIVSRKDSFTVNKPYYNVDSTKSSFTYGDLYSSMATAGYGKGLKLDLVEGDYFHCARPINVYSEDVFSIITFNSIEFDDPPKTCGINVRLTDCYDSSIYMDISFKRVDYQYASYFSTGANGAGSVGIEKDSNGTILIDNEPYSINSYGTPVAGNYKIKKDDGTYQTGANDYTLYFDNTVEGRPRIYAESDGTKKYLLVREYNNTDISNATFEGFTNGNVYVSIGATSLNGSTSAPIEIGQIGGLSGSDLIPAGEYLDSNSPVITVDCGETGNEILAGYEVKIPKASVQDDTLVKGDCSITVWYNYENATARKTINTYKDSFGNLVFKPTKLGNYTVEYVAYDVYGNKATKLITLSASKSGSKPFEFTCTQIANNTPAGTSVSLNNYTLTSLSGKHSVYARVEGPNGISVVLEDLTKSYTLEKVGDYKVTYIYNDNFYVGTYSYTFNTAASTVPVFTNTFIPTPNYYIINGKYSLENIPAYLYTENGKEAQPLTAYVSYDGGAYTSAGFNKDEFTIPSGHDTIRFKLECTNNPSVCIESNIARIVDVEYNAATSMNVVKYFQGAGFSGNLETNDLAFVSRSTTGTGDLEYVNKMALSQFSLVYQIPTGYTMGGMKFIFTDYYNHSKTHTVTLSGTDVVTVDDGENIVLTSNWKGTDSSLSFSYDDKSQALIFGNNTIALPNDFTNDYMLFKMEFTGLVKDSSTFKVLSLCGQAFNTKITKDTTAPILLSDFGSSVAVLGEKVTISNPIYFDMLSPSSDKKCYFDVTYDGEAVTDVNGVVLNNITDFTKEYTFEIAKYGEYCIFICFTDGSKRSANLMQYIKCVDIIPPTVELSKESDEQSAGYNVTPLEVTVSDNATATEDIRIWYVAYDSNGRFVDSVQKGSTFSITTKGEYKVYVYVLDGVGNVTYKSYKLTIK